MFTQLENRQSISQLISDQIEGAILEKKYLPGSKLPSENELAEMFGVSRTSVREALTICATHGFVKIEKGKGVFVLNFSSENVTNSFLKFFEHRLEDDWPLDLVRARKMIEPGIAYYAALNRDDKNLGKMFETIEGMEKNIEKNAAKHSQYDLDFHLQLAFATKNKFSPLILKPLQQLIPRIKSDVLQSVDDAIPSAIEWHTKIYNAVKSGEADLARTMMVEHLKIAELHIRKTFENKTKTTEETND